MIVSRRRDLALTEFKPSCCSLTLSGRTARVSSFLLITAFRLVILVWAKFNCIFRYSSWSASESAGAFRFNRLGRLIDGLRADGAGHVSGDIIDQAGAGKLICSDSIVECRTAATELSLRILLPWTCTSLVCSVVQVDSDTSRDTTRFTNGDPEDSLQACEKPGERRESRDCHGFVEPSRALDDVTIHFPELFHL